jgi:hypothetical protein
VAAPQSLPAPGCAVAGASPRVEVGLAPAPPLGIRSLACGRAPAGSPRRRLLPRPRAPTISPSRTSSRATSPRAEPGLDQRHGPDRGRPPQLERERRGEHDVGRLADDQAHAAGAVPLAGAAYAGGLAAASSRSTLSMHVMSNVDLDRGKAARSTLRTVSSGAMARRVTEVGRGASPRRTRGAAAMPGPQTAATGPPPYLPAVRAVADARAPGRRDEHNVKLGRSPCSRSTLSMHVMANVGLGRRGAPARR